MTQERETAVKYMKRFSPVAICAALMLAATISHADSVTCSPNIGYSQPIGDNVTHSTACEIGGANNDSVSQVNTDTMFSFADWSAFGSANGSITGMGDPPATTISGTISLAGVDWTTFGSLMLVFKDGNGQPDTFVGYLMETGYSGSVSWTTPFLNTRSGNPKDVSHIRAYVRGTYVPPPPPTCEELGNCPPPPTCEELGNCPPPPTCEELGNCPPPPTCEELGTCPPPPCEDCTPNEVPEPGTLLLFGSGLLGMAKFLRRKLPR